ncbi:hypothetical protein NDU88_004762 [Pleurodeles waltl]|uniref:Uncharacterized protein n=1 Tax=Pleurodeles waltl TaxID=8319 RepID=A0AAV7RM78_PLEWA|nr:hypothetical protein NDU88_004762 [Pleurodeles waltl]
MKRATQNMIPRCANSRNHGDSLESRRDGVLEHIVLQGGNIQEARAAELDLTWPHQEPEQDTPEPRDDRTGGPADERSAPRSPEDAPPKTQVDEPRWYHQTRHQARG